MLFVTVNHVYVLVMVIILYCIAIRGGKGIFFNHGFSLTFLHCILVLCRVYVNTKVCLRSESSKHVKINVFRKDSIKTCFWVQKVGGGGETGREEGSSRYPYICILNKNYRVNDWKCG